MIRSPVRDADGRLTAPEVIPRSSPNTTRRKPDPLLLLPAFGLLFCGVAATGVNGVFAYRLATDPAAVERMVRGQVGELRGVGAWADDPAEERDRRDDERAERGVALLRRASQPATAVGMLTFLGGLSIALRWNRRVAQAGCVAAAVNVAHLCCIPGTVAGLWGLLMLASDEGKAHFAR